MEERFGVSDTFRQLECPSCRADRRLTVVMVHVEHHQSRIGERELFAFGQLFKQRDRLADRRFCLGASPSAQKEPGLPAQGVGLIQGVAHLPVQLDGALLHRDG